MNESEVRPEESPSTDMLSGRKRMAVYIALGGVFGFALGFIVGWLTGLGAALVGTLGMCMGAAASLGVTR
jgi:hypothetical protein